MTRGQRAVYIAFWTVVSSFGAAFAAVYIGALLAAANLFPMWLRG